MSIKNSSRTDGIEEIAWENKLLAIIIYADYKNDGISFFTPGDFSQQLGYMCHPAGKKIQAHIHNVVPREVKYTQEVLLVRKGRVRVDFYDEDKVVFESRVLVTGDLILLASGGHGFEMLEETEMFEIKQGPYAGDEDKTRF